MLRDGEIDQLETLVFSAVTGLVIAEVRLTMHYLPIDGHLAALTLLLAFYFVTGLIHAHVTRQLDRNAALEYVTIAVTGEHPTTLDFETREWDQPVVTFMGRLRH